jgi:hypothetical protein
MKNFSKRLMVAVMAVMALAMVVKPGTVSAATKYTYVPMIGKAVSSSYNDPNINFEKEGEKATISVAFEKYTVGGGYVEDIYIAQKNYKKYSVTFKSSDTKVATVNKKGVVTIKKDGCATITVTVKYKKKTYKSEVYVSLGLTADERKLLGMLKEYFGPNVEELSDLEKVYAAHNWVYAHISYSLENRTSNALTVAERGYGACSEFSMLTCTFLNILGVENKYTGSATHAWYKVKLNGKWYDLDAQGKFGGTQVASIYDDYGITNATDTALVRQAKILEFEKSFKNHVGWNDADTGVKDLKWTYDSSLTRVPCTEEDLDPSII